MKIIVRSTQEIKDAEYGTTPAGHKRMNVDGKFYTDKKFDALFEVITEENKMAWKVHMRNMFDEIIQANDSMKIFHKPFCITMRILGEAATYAAELRNERMIGYFARLALYKFSDPTDPEFDKVRTGYYINKTD